MLLNTRFVCQADSNVCPPHFEPFANTPQSRDTLFGYLELEVDKTPCMPGIVDLYVALDNSGSMSEQSKMKHAKAAVAALIVSLKECLATQVAAAESDSTTSTPTTDVLLSVLSFNTSVVKRFEKKSIQAMTQQDMHDVIESINEIHPFGGTNIGEAVLAMNASIPALPSPLVQAQLYNQPVRILHALLSDGDATAGLGSRRTLTGLDSDDQLVEIVQDRVEFSTLGFGKDYNDKVMTGMVSKFNNGGQLFQIVDTEASLGNAMGGLCFNILFTVFKGLKIKIFGDGIPIEGLYDAFNDSFTHEIYLATLMSESSKKFATRVPKGMSDKISLTLEADLCLLNNKSFSQFTQLHATEVAMDHTDEEKWPLFLQEVRYRHLQNMFVANALNKQIATSKRNRDYEKELKEVRLSLKLWFRTLKAFHESVGTGEGSEIMKNAVEEFFTDIITILKTVGTNRGEMYSRNRLNCQALGSSYCGWKVDKMDMSLEYLAEQRVHFTEHLAIAGGATPNARGRLAVGAGAAGAADPDTPDSDESTPFKRLAGGMNNSILTPPSFAVPLQRSHEMMSPGPLQRDMLYINRTTFRSPPPPPPPPSQTDDVESVAAQDVFAFKDIGDALYGLPPAGWTPEKDPYYYLQTEDPVDSSLPSALERSISSHTTKRERSIMVQTSQAMTERLESQTQQDHSLTPSIQSPILLQRSSSLASKQQTQTTF